LSTTGDTVRHEASAPRRFISQWARTPLYLQILIGLVLGAVTGLVLGPRAGWLDLPSRLILRLLGALAPPLILVAVVRALMTAQVRGRLALRMVGLLALNTVVAILVGLLVANVVRPGRFAHLSRPDAPTQVRANFVTQLLDNIPDSLVRPFVENKVIAVVMIAVAFGVALRREQGRRRALADDLVNLGFDLILTLLHWVIVLVPLAVWGKVASIVGKEGFRPFAALGVFVGAVLLALAIQAAYYLVRIRLGSWVCPARLLRETRDALVMAFSTASSTVTMPITYTRLKDGVGLRERSASLGALVGSNFNNDGTALYEAMAALFVAQLLGLHLTPFQQVMVVLTSVVASIGAAGIPEAGLVTMTLVFSAVHLPTEYIALLLTVDWFLDRCRTVINVLGDMNVSCLLDGKERQGPTEVFTGAVPLPAQA
jgi:DAACS family dicarboxylate/amino acid:cation (Na+ or H+) symporter